MPGGSHSSQDLIGYLIPADVPEPARQPAGHYGTTAVQKPAKEIGRFDDHRQGRPQIGRVFGKI